MKWFFEMRGNNEFAPPVITTILQGWEKYKGDLESPLDPADEVFVREVVQNFVDAARDKSPLQPEHIRPKLTFQFHSLSGVDASRVWSELDMENFISQRNGISDTSGMRLPDSAWYQGMPKNLSLLVVREHGTTGMYGHWDRSFQAKDAHGKQILHKMRDAFLAVVRGSAGKGLGSYGEGKKAVIGVSKLRAVLAYTAFDKQTSENHCSRRLMAGGYWQNYTKGNTEYSGFAMLGEPSLEQGEKPRPYEDHDADQIVKQLAIPGFEVRDGSDPKQWGTTMAFLDPQITPESVVTALVRNWWPLMEDGAFDFEVINAHGNVQPLSTPEYLEPFIDLYRSTSENKVTDWSQAVGGPATRLTQVTSDVNGDPMIGQLKLAIDLRPVVGWSRKNPESNASIVALIREGMIISYQQFPRSRKTSAPFVRGIFRVSSDSSPLSEQALRRTEPPLHNKWVDRDAEYISSKDKDVAKEVFRAIDSNVESFRQEHIEVNARLETYLEIFADAFDVRGGARVSRRRDVVAAPTGTPWSMLAGSESLKNVGGGYRTATASRSLKLAVGIEAEHKVRVEIGWQVLEDNAWTEANRELIVGPIQGPDGFDISEDSFNVFVGYVTAVPKIFTWTSAPYSQLWTLRPYMKVTSLETIQEAAHGN